MAPAREPASVWNIPRKKAKYGVIAAVAVVALIALYVAFGRHGALTVTVTGPGGRAIEGVTVFVDGTKRCDNSPCRIDDLAPGAHMIRAGGKGYQATADQAVSVAAGEQATHNVSLSPAGDGTGVRVSALGSGLKLFVDGQEVGELPQTAKNLSAGEHTIRVGGNDRYEPWEQRIKLEDGEMKAIGPLSLRVLKGLATFKAGPGAEGARALLDGRLVPELPSTIEVPAGKQLTLTATKRGYSSYRRTVSFDDGIAEKTFEITMVEDGAPKPVADVTEAPRGAAPTPRTSPVVTSKAPAGGKATVNLNSIPQSNVILNGRPLGQTPKLGVQVPPGPQTIVFVHPDFGRKVVTGSVAAGETKTFSARFK